MKKQLYLLLFLVFSLSAVSTTGFAQTAPVNRISGGAPTASPTFTGTVTVPTPTVLSNTTVAPSTAWVKAKLPYVINVLDYGAIVGDGADDATAINAAITAAAAGQTVYFPDGTYNLATTPIALNKSINLLGGNATINVSGNNNAITITALSTKIEHLKIVGSGGKDSGFTLQRGISSDGYYYTQYTNLDISSIGGVGIYIKNTAPSGLRYGAVITNCNFNANNIGYLADVAAEYVTLTGCNFKFCNSGVIVRAGNNNFVGGSITDNLTVGVKLEGVTLNATYTNDGHGIFDGVMINHNRTASGSTYISGYNINADGLSLGYLFNNCTIYDSKIWLKNCVGVSFNACQLAPIEIRFENSTVTMFNNNSLYTTYGFTLSNNYNTTTSQTYWLNNQAMNGTGGIVAGVNLANVNAATSTFQLTGSFAPFSRSITSLRTLDSTDQTVFANGTFTVTLPTAVTCLDREYVIKNTGAGTITLATTSSQTIDGTTPGTLAAGKYVRLKSDGAGWQTIANN